MVGCLVINVWLNQRKIGWLVGGWIDHITRQQQIMSIIYCSNLFVHLKVIYNMLVWLLCIDASTVENNKDFCYVLKITKELILKVPEQKQIAGVSATGHSIAFKMIIAGNDLSLVRRAKAASRDVYRKLQKIQVGICC